MVWKLWNKQVLFDNLQIYEEERYFVSFEQALRFEMACGIQKPQACHFPDSAAAFFLSPRQ